MKPIIFKTGKTGTGFDAYHENSKGVIIAVTTGDTMEKLKQNALESYNLYAEYTGGEPALIDQIQFETATFN